MNTQTDLLEYANKQDDLIEKLLKADPSLPHVTAIIMAGDLMSAERAAEEVAAGVPASQAVQLVGSYARWEFAIQMVAQKALTEGWFFDHICDLWRGSDPDDTKPEYLALWNRARARNGGVVRDGRPLPKAGPDGLIRVYRGGSPFSVRNGFAWTTDPKVARVFANGAGVRHPMANGVVISGRVRPGQVLAFITGRKESEVIVDPRLVSHVKTGEPK